jgi:two-component system sensor histidine kinase UhpB
VPTSPLTAWAFYLSGALGAVILLGALLTALAVTHRRRLRAEREHAQQLVAAQDDERARVARELHDDALQRVMLIRHELEVAGEHGGAEMTRRIAGLDAELEDLGVVLRSAAHQLHPSVVEKAGLVRALEALALTVRESEGVEVHCALPPPDLTVPPAVALAAYRVAQESLRNVVKHSGAPEAHLTVTMDAGVLTIRIADKGLGFDVRVVEEQGGLGLLAMKQRTAAAGGRLTVTARRDEGTVVTARFPGRKGR